MDIKYTIKNNFLNQADYESIKNIIMGDEFPWYFQQTVASPKKHDSQFYWAHTFFNRTRGILSPFYGTLVPLFKALEAKAFIRVRANLYPNQGKIIEHAYHADFPFKHKGALFSLNTCNGFTALADGTKIKSVANRLLMFDTSTKHHSSTCTDAKVRCNINVNYF